MSPDIQWQRVLARDARFDGAFVYAVRSTGIYCRPSCPSRRPRRAQVEFFPAPTLAEQAGFRACRRCRPRAVQGADPAVRLVMEVCAAIQNDFESTATLRALGRQTGMSPFHLQRVFRKTLGITPRQYAHALRLARFKTAVRKGGNVTTALYDAGFGSSSRLYEKAGEDLGMTPATYGAHGKGARIRYTIAPSDLGRVLVAATERGICAVSLGDRDQKLEKALREDYSAATITRDDRGLQPMVKAVLEHLQGRQSSAALPLDVRATAFQLRVLELLRRIPRGATRTYTEVARLAGRPAAVRAVANVCARNKVAVVIPCHRVLRSDGTLGGYRWGLERKAELLRREANRPLTAKDTRATRETTSR